MLSFNDKAHMPYQHVLKGWQPKVMGPKPANEAFHIAACFVQRVGGVELLHVAMLQRPDGCTAMQFVAAARLINPNAGRADNTMRRLAGIVNKVDTGTGVFTLAINGNVRKFTLSPRGKAVVKAALAVKASMAKAAETSNAAVTGDKPKAAKKATSKPRKPAAKPVATAPATVQAVTAPPVSDAAH